LPFDLTCLRHRHLRRIEHIFDENSVARGGIVYHNVRDSAGDFSILNDGGAGQVCGQERTTKFNGNFIKLIILG